MDINPQPGDTWTLHGHPTIEVVSVTAGDVYYVSGKDPMREPLDRFVELAQRSVDRGAVLRRGNEVMCKELEDFEV